jgi:peptidoglycan hydrolase CwlO-like protein
LIREREESKTHLDQAWEHSQTCLAQLEEAHNLGAVLQQVINEHPESRSLRQKFDQSNQGLEHIQKEINELKAAIATELCCRSRYVR